MRRERVGRIDLNIQPWHKEICQAPAGYPFTPDLWRLTKYRGQLLFVYDEWMSDRHQSFVVKEIGESLGKAFTRDKFDFLIKATDPNKTAVALSNPDGNKIMGEVYALEPEAFNSLDKLTLNGLQSLRHRVHVLFPYREHGYVQNYNGFCTPDGYELPEALQGLKHWVGPEKVYILQCWMYQGHPDYWQEMVYKNPFFFDRVPRFEPKKEKTWLDRYYRYQNP